MKLSSQELVTKTGKNQKHTRDCSGHFQVFTTTKHDQSCFGFIWQHLLSREIRMAFVDINQLSRQDFELDFN